MTGAGNVFGDLPVALSSVDSRRLSAPTSLKSSDNDVMAGIFLVVNVIVLSLPHQYSVSL